MKRPEARARILGDMNRRLKEIRTEANRMRQIFGKENQKIVVDPRAMKSLRKEAAMRQALREDELVNEVWKNWGNLLGDEIMDGALTKLREQPLHAYLAQPGSKLQGRLMSKAAAIKSGKYDPTVHGDYDAAGGANRTLFGGSLMPDEAARQRMVNLIGLTGRPPWD